MIDSLRAMFWSERFWLPHGCNWSTLAEDVDKYPQFDDLYRPIAWALPMLIVRMVFEWTIARPFGVYLGIGDRHSALPNMLRKMSTTLNSFVGNEMLDLEEKSVKTTGAAYTNGSTVHRYRRGRASVGISKSTLDNWRLAFYFSIFCYGLFALWDKSWLTNSDEFWLDYPHHTLAPSIWWYYMLECTFYWSLMFSQFVDVHRKDFAVNLIHHICTLTLLYMSWATNFIRVGSAVILLHDAADSWMEVPIGYVQKAGKMATYSNYKQTCNFLFAVFVIVWFVTRLFIFPIRIMHSVVIVSPSLMPFFNGYYVFCALLCTLQVLHVFWSWFILRIIYKALTKGEVDDTRSDNEEDEEEMDDKKIN